LLDIKGDLKMKNVVIIPFTSLLIGMFSTIHPALAEERANVYEMAESGQTFSFLMTSKEIAREDAENAKLAASKKANPEEQNRQVDIYELAESGIKIDFPVETTDNTLFEDVAEKNILDDSKM
jgi:hypothetical protein